MLLNSYVNLKINDSDFTITKAVIKENLEEIFTAECEGYFESMENPLLQKLNNINSNNNISTYGFLDKQATLTLKNFTSSASGGANSVNLNSGESGDQSVYKGIISQVKFIGSSSSDSKSDNINSSSINLSNSIKQKYFFKFTLSSPLFRLSINRANRIFIDKTTIEVIKEILKFYQATLLKEVDFSNIKNSYKSKEYIAQYNESDLAFLKRLCFNNGIYFYEDENKIYFYDVIYFVDGENYTGASADAQPAQADKNINFNPNINNTLNEECIKWIDKTEILSADSFSHSLQDTTHPVSLNMLNSDTISKDKNQYNEHTYLGQYSFSEHESLQLPTGLKKLRSVLDLNTYEATSNVFGLKLNENISISTQDGSAKSENSNLSFKIAALTQTFIDESNLENRLDTNDIIPLGGKTFSTSYSNQITMLPTSVAFVPTFQAKPRAPEVTLGVVTGGNDIDGEKNTIHTDEFGRIKVRINAFSTQESIDNSAYKTDGENGMSGYSCSAYLRVMMPIASNNSGFFAIPRIGDEVVISFLEDDIDKPVVSGSLYNTYNPALPNLPGNYHQTTLSSKTIGVNESGRNEITLSNIKDKEQIYLKAEKDYDELVQHDFTQTIQNDKSSKVAGTYTERINQAHIQTIDLAKNVNVGAEYLTTVGLSRDTLVGVSNTLNVGVDNKLRVGKNSSEFIGKDKSVEVNGNFNTTIEKDEHNTVKQSKKEVVEGSYELNVSKGINNFCEEHITLQANNYIDIKAKSNFTTNTDAQHMEVAESKFSEFKSKFEMDAGDEIIHQVGSTKVVIDGSSVVISVGGVKAVIDSRGLTVIGGEIKAE